MEYFSRHLSKNKMFYKSTYALLLPMFSLTGCTSQTYVKRSVYSLQKLIFFAVTTLLVQALGLKLNYFSAIILGGPKFDFY